MSNGDLDRLMARLSQLYTPHEAFAWMHGPHPQLDGQSPMEAINQGKRKEVDAILDRLDGGVYL